MRAYFSVETRAAKKKLLKKLRRKRRARPVQRHYRIAWHEEPTTRSVLPPRDEELDLWVPAAEIRKHYRDFKKRRKLPGQARRYSRFKLFEVVQEEIVKKIG